ncbi:hypothetical protein F4808DRAFT_448173 [Astrocystis sublimbata]|nr:hypothetical protein F4808DRAFT_448173 [Astrocystis sublimbata]
MQSYDESHFSADREGNAKEPGSTFSIEGSDELAPTRPSSPSKQQPPDRQTKEDADLARAIAASQYESGVVPQEAGLVADGVPPGTYGPANQQTHDPTERAMVRVNANGDADHASSDHPVGPSQMRRTPGAPGFIWQTGFHRIGCILSIYHQIPLARNFLLRCGEAAADYNYASDWWSGKPIVPPEREERLRNGEEPSKEDRTDFAQELHRLMAFLDSADRAFASADNIAKIIEIDESRGSWSPDCEEMLFQALSNSSIDNIDSGLAQMTTAGRITLVAPPSPNGSHSDDNEDDNSSSFIFLDISLDHGNSSCVDTLYDALDHLLWSSALSMDFAFPNDPFPEAANTAVLTMPGEVLTMRIGGTGLSKECEIPAVFYADRYLDSRKDQGIRFQTQMRELKKALKRLDLAEKAQATCSGQICSFSVQGFGQSHDIRDCCGKMAEYTERLLERQKRSVQWRYYQSQWKRGENYTMDDIRLLHSWSGPAHFTDTEMAEREKLEHILKKCKELVQAANITSAAYKTQREELTSYLNVVRKRLTCQEDEVDNERYIFRSDPGVYRPDYWDPVVKYSLRGVATTSDIAYVCVQEREKSHVPGEAPVVVDRWWQVGFVKDDVDDPVKQHEISLEEVLKAAGKESKHPILVYAQDSAMSQDPIPLSRALNVCIVPCNPAVLPKITQRGGLNPRSRFSSQMTTPLHEQVQDKPTMGVTAEALSQISMEPSGKRKYSVESSVATNGSVRSELADVGGLEFEDNASAKLPSDMPPRCPATCRKDDESLDSEVASVSEGAENNREQKKGGVQEPQISLPNGNQSDHKDSATQATCSQKQPEMEERRGGMNPFLVRPGPAIQKGPDNMDIDSEDKSGWG